MLPFRDFPGDESRTDGEAKWQSAALKSFTEILPKRDGEAIPPNRLISVLQGWDVTPKQQEAQIQRSIAVGVSGYIIALTKIEQSWEPRMFTIQAKANAIERRSDRMPEKAGRNSPTRR